MHIVGKSKIYLYELQKQEQKAFLWWAIPFCFERSTNKIYISVQCT